MSDALLILERPQSLGEEIANSVSHGVALLAAMAAFPVLVMAAQQRGDMAGIVAASVFATTMVLLYLASAMFHALPRSRAKRVFQILDHSAIYFMIAGTYTPFTLGVLQNALATGAAPEAKLHAFRSAACYLSAVFLVGLIALAFLPETKGQPLPEDIPVTK